MRRILTALVGLAALAAVPVTAQISRIIVIQDGSGTITTANTSQQVFAAKADRGYLFCQNPTTATESLFVNYGASASTSAGSIELSPGGVSQFLGLAVPTTNVTVTAATAGHRFVCKQGGPS